MKFLTVLILTTVLTACGTVGGAVSGAGQDLSKAGEWIRSRWKIIMRKILALVPVIAVLAACSSSPKDPYERRAYEERERQEKYVERTLDKAPKWMTELPSSANAVYANGTAASGDFSMADYKAKMMAFGKICIAAGGTVSQQGKIFMQDTSDASHETSELAIKTMCPSVDVTGVEVKEIKRISEGNRYRTYVLVALPTGDANLLQKRKDQQRLQNRAETRSAAAFDEMNKTSKSAQ